MTAEQQLERSVLEGKERDELSAIAQAMSLKTTSRTKKADIIDQILEATGVTSGSGARRIEQRGCGPTPKPTAPGRPGAPGHRRRRRGRGRRGRRPTIAGDTETCRWLSCGVGAGDGCRPTADPTMMATTAAVPATIHATTPADGAERIRTAPSPWSTVDVESTAPTPRRPPARPRIRADPAGQPQPPEPGQPATATSPTATSATGATAGAAAATVRRQGGELQGGGQEQPYSGELVAVSGHARPARRGLRLPALRGLPAFVQGRLRLDQPGPSLRAPQGRLRRGCVPAGVEQREVPGPAAHRHGVGHRPRGGAQPAPLRGPHAALPRLEARTSRCPATRTT